MPPLPSSSSRGRGLAALLLAAAVAAPAGGQGLPSFEGVGDLGGGPFESAAEAVSADGATVVGASRGSEGQQAFRWTAGAGMTGLGFLSASNPDSEALGVSADGSVIVGMARNADGDRGFRWTISGGMIGLGTFSCSGCDPSSSANGVSGDGLVVVGLGLAKSLFGDPVVHAARWPGGGTGVSDLGDLPGPGDANVAHGASTTGDRIVGGGNSSSGVRAWTWSASGGMAPLPGIAGAQTFGTALAISDDASTVVGYANTSASGTSALEAVRWTGPGFGTIELLGFLPGAASTGSAATAVSGDGSVIVGRARNAANADSAFVWTAAGGLRELRGVLEQDYGLELSGWLLHEATGVSDVDANGAYTIVGRGRNPAGDPEGWVAVLEPPACGDGLDNDADGQTDFPADPQCTAVFDLSEGVDCSDGLDNDRDGASDGADAGCTDPADQSEEPDCGDGFDNDGDGQADFPADPGCADPGQAIEDPACDDCVDNDGDGDTDGADAGCVSGADLSETADCADGLDNDGDGASDGADADCDDGQDPSEAPECRDGVDNDLDGAVDYPAGYPDCTEADDPREAPQCADGADNDGDGQIDFGGDPECAGPLGAREAPGSFAAGELLVLDRRSRALFALASSGGPQRLLSEKALLGSPEGLAQTAKGELVVADPAGLFAIDAVTGAQRRASEALTSDGSLQLAIAADDRVFVAESDEISTLVFDRVGVASPQTWLPVPTLEQPFPVLGVLSGGTLALAQDGTAYTTGLSFYGDGVYRIDPLPTPSATLLASGFDEDVWLDLAIESPTALVAVARNASAGPGLYRIPTATGGSTPIRVGLPFVEPTGVAVAPGGALYVADAGSCASQCTGGGIYHVDPGTGIATLLSSGGAIEGEMDLVVAVPEPHAPLVLCAGALLLARLAVRRRRRRRLTA